MRETQIHLVRHGKVHNPDNIRYGQIAGYHLSELGRDQARAAGAYLASLAPPIAAIAVSPLERAQETAALIAEALGGNIPVTTDPRVIEPPTRFDGISRYAPLLPWKWPLFWNPFRPSWSEPFASVIARVRAAIEELRAAHEGGAAAIVAHQAPIWIARHSLDRGGPPWMSPVKTSPASVTTLRFTGDTYAGYTYWAQKNS